MGTRTIRRTSVTLPSLDEPGLYLSNVTSLDSARGRVAEFHYGDAELRALELADTHLIDGRVRRLRTERTRLERVRIDSVEFTGCDLASLHWSDSKISRTVFRNCKLMGGVLDDIALDNVLFENCRLDYSTLTRVRSTGPVIFSRCSLREASVEMPDLARAAVSDCDLRLTEFHGGTYAGLDLRGNDLSQIRGLASLRRITIDREQALQLAQALAAELDVTWGEDLDVP